MVHIAIAGAGPVGLAAALLLCKEDFKVTIYERASKETLYKDSGSAFSLTPATLYVLKRLNLYEKVMELVGTYETMITTTSEGKLLSRAKVDYETETPLGRFDKTGMSRSLFQRVLMGEMKEFIDNGMVILECESQVTSFVDYSQIPSSKKNLVEVVVKTRDSQFTKSFDVLLGCDGIHSKVRSCLIDNLNKDNLKSGKEEIKDDLNYTGITAFWAKFDFQAMLESSSDEERLKAQEVVDYGVNSSSTLNAFYTSSLPLSFFAGMLPELTKDKSSNKLAWCVFIKDDDITPCEFEVDEDEMDLTKRGGKAGAKPQALNCFRNKDGSPRCKNLDGNLIYKIIQMTPKENVVQVGIFDRKNLDIPFARGRVALLGDSAHPQTPFLGQGVNMGITDAYCATQYIIKCPSDQLHVALEQYNNKERLKSSKTNVVTARDYADYAVSLSWFGGMVVRFIAKYFVGWFTERSLAKSDAPNINAILRAEKWIVCT